MSTITRAPGLPTSGAHHRDKADRLRRARWRLISICCIAVVAVLLILAA